MGTEPPVFDNIVGPFIWLTSLTLCLLLRRKNDFVCSVIPLDTQLSAVDSLIDSMMLVEEDDDGKKIDMFKVHHIPHPGFQRLFQVL